MKETKSAAAKRVTKMNGFTPYYIYRHTQKEKGKRKEIQKTEELHGLGQACNVRIVGHKRFGRKRAKEMII